MRLDIQFLRGIAVIFVLLFHSNIIPFPYGFLGVDIFFVVSGFLITSKILKDLNESKFSFIDFYKGRARRLLPALLTTLLVTTALAPIFLTRTEMQAFVKQLIGTLTFSANFALMSQAGYFGAEAHSKPLLHMWSLSIEEQYYFAVPLVLYLCFLPISKHLFRCNPAPWILAIGVVLSFALCLFFVDRDPNIAFYFSMTRFWELLAGSMAAWLMMRKPSLHVKPFVKFAAVTLLLCMAFITIDPMHPRLSAVVVVIATAAILIDSREWLPRNPIATITAKIGDWSYSLYLVHWPLFAYANSAFLGEIPFSVRLGLLAASFVLAFLQYKYVETPFRREWKLKQKREALGFATAFGIAILAFTPILVPSKASAVNYEELYRPNYGFDQKCSQAISFQPLQNCMTNDKPTVAVWGDSYAMHLVQGLANNDKLSLVQLSSAFCGPLLGMAFVDNHYSSQWAQNCIDFNDSAFDFIKDASSVRYVVLGSIFSQYFASDDGRSLFYNGRPTDNGKKLAVGSLITTINAIRDAGKIPVIVAPSPANGINLGACVERMMEKRPIWGRENCAFPLNEFKEKWREVITSLREVEQRTGVRVFWPHEKICDTNTCYPFLDDVHIYRDTGHLTRPGSIFVVQQMGLDTYLEQ